MLNQARFFHTQKFPVEISQKEMLQKIKDAKYKEELKEEDNEDDDSEHESQVEESKEETKEESKQIDELTA